MLRLIKNTLLKELCSPPTCCCGNYRRPGRCSHCRVISAVTQRKPSSAFLCLPVPGRVWPGRLKLTSPIHGLDCVTWRRQLEKIKATLVIFLK